MVVLFFLFGGHTASEYVNGYVDRNICAKQGSVSSEECSVRIERASSYNLIPLTADIYGETVGKHPYRLGKFTGVKPLQKDIDGTISGLIATVLVLSFIVLLFFHLTWRSFFKHLFKNPYS